MQLEKVGSVWHEYCLANKVLKILLPLNIPLLMVTAVLRNLQNFISLGSAAGVIIYVGFITGILLTFAKAEYRMLSVGMGIYMLDYVYGISRSLLKYHNINWGSIMYLLVWGYFTYAAYKKSIKNEGK